ncbi:hypothetical protein BJF79_07665 [Actinomadura sp. CNU-125]|uniref:glycerophosphoryl diester phosphodiesterase membrane domain-containing protein n=1 Tax=Actinomadura sp. CNU-125 TaxID=1904961 RepID=UPI000960958E|nr:glycerophosphoryl diester phosphodiesterase membrane domain-containing protein [Actinomadura sp. CNU-125]OLT33776.1 hypothetical protein BJF79_07665 [Actinomadura sp. CNU-125]
MPGPDGRDAAVEEAVPFRPMSISELLDGVIAGIRRRPRVILGMSATVAAVIQVAGSIVAFFFIGDDAREETTPDVLLSSLGAQATLNVLLLVLSGFGILLLAGLLAPLLGRELLGMPVPPRPPRDDRSPHRGAGSPLRDARPVLGRLVGTAATVMGVSLLAVAVPVVPFVLLAAAGAHPALVVAAAILGFSVGFALMVWLYVLLVQAVPAVVLERRTVGGALKRARALTKGRWWRLCGALLLALLVTVFMGLFALRIPFIVAQLVFFGDGGDTLGALAVDTAGRIVAWSVVLPFDAGVIAMLYMDQRMRREGFDLEVRMQRTASSASSSKDTRQSLDAQESEEDPFIALWRPANETGATL